MTRTPLSRSKDQESTCRERVPIVAACRTARCVNVCQMALAGSLGYGKICQWRIIGRRVTSLRTIIKRLWCVSLSQSTRLCDLVYLSLCLSVCVSVCLRMDVDKMFRVDSQWYTKVLVVFGVILRWTSVLDFPGQSLGTYHLTLSWIFPGFDIFWPFNGKYAWSFHTRNRTIKKNCNNRLYALLPVR